MKKFLSVVIQSAILISVACCSFSFAEEDSSARFPFGSKEYYFARMVKPYKSKWTPAVLIRDFPEMSAEGVPHYYRFGGEKQRQLMIGEVIISTDPDIKPGTVLIREGFGSPEHDDHSSFHVINTVKEAHFTVCPLKKDGSVFYVASDGWEYSLSGKRLKKFPDELLQGPWMEMKKAVLQGEK